MRKVKNHNLMIYCFNFFICFLPIQDIAASCSVAASPVNFGTYNVFTTSNNLSIGQITVTCNPVNTPYTVALNSGLYGTIAQRKLSAGGSDRLFYNLYTDPSRSILWGDGSTNGVTVSSAGTTPLNVYGSITARQDVAVGNYSDSVAITVTF